MEELYVEILYTIFHMIGCDAEKTDQGALVDHLKEAFHMGLFHLQKRLGMGGSSEPLDFETSKIYITVH